MRQALLAYKCLEKYQGKFRKNQRKIWRKVKNVQEKFGESVKKKIVAAVFIGTFRHRFERAGKV